MASKPLRCRFEVSDSHAVTASGVFVIGSITLENVNLGIAVISGLCGLIVILPKAIETLKRAEWRKIFRREPKR